MKRVISLILSLMVLISAAGCAPKEKPAVPSAPLTEDDILAAYEEAARVYDWFDLCSPSCTGEPLVHGGMSYRRVDEEGIGTYDDLESKVHSLFAPELADSILENSSNFVDIDGKLYCAEGARGSNIYLDTKGISVEHPDQDHWLVNLSFWTDTEEEGVFTTGYSREVLNYELTDEGFRFTNFCSSDALDLEAETVCTFDLEQDCRNGVYAGYSDWQLLCYLCHAEGICAEAGLDLLYSRFTERPQDVLQALGILSESPFRRLQEAKVDSILAAPGEYAFSHGQEEEKFLAALDLCEPENEAQKQVLSMIRNAYFAPALSSDAPPQA